MKSGAFWFFTVTFRTPLLADAPVALTASACNEFSPALNKTVSEQDPEALAIQAAADGYGQFVKNFEYTYKRRNLRQTFVIAFLLVFAVNLPVGSIYQKARALSPEDTAALAEKYVNIYKELTAEPESRGEELREEKPAENLAALKQNALAIVASTPAQTAPPSFFVDVKQVLSGWGELFRYLFGCLMTALLVGFGAPVWNDLASLFFRLQKGKNGSNGSTAARRA